MNIDKSIQLKAIEVTCHTVLGEDAAGLDQEHFEIVRTIIQGFMWSEESFIIAKTAANDIRSDLQLMGGLDG